MTAQEKLDLHDHPGTLKHRQFSRAAVHKLNHEPVLSLAVFPVSFIAWSQYIYALRQDAIKKKICDPVINVCLTKED